VVVWVDGEVAIEVLFPQLGTTKLLAALGLVGTFAVFGTWLATRLLFLVPLGLSGS
jgi:hypothetical protein